MKKFIEYYSNLMEKYILVKVGTILLITMLLAQVMTLINKNINKKISNENPISKYNTYSSETIGIDNISNRYFCEYTGLLQYDINLAYELLDEDFKKQFNNINDFKKYIENVNFEDLAMSECTTSSEEECKKYIISDNLNNAYTFLVEEPNKYTVILSYK